MSVEHDFLVKYGIHNFVSCAEKAGKQTFFIRKSERDSMIKHAKSLITGAYGDTTDIRII